MFIQFGCLSSYFISRDVTLESCLIQMQIKFPREWMTNLKDNSPENIHEAEQVLLLF